MLGRLRAALTPQAAVLLAAIALLSWLMLGYGQKQTESLEEKAARLLSHVDGAGDVYVAIAYRGQETGASTGLLRASNESDMERIPYGAAAVAQGGDDPIVRMKLTQLLSAMLGLPASAVSVVGMNGI